MTDQVNEAVAWTDDAQKWGNALNEASWTFIETCPEKSLLLFNTAKGALRAAILRYAEFVAAVNPALAHPSRGVVDGLCERLQQKCSDWGTYWRAPDAHGVNLSMDQALELLRDALGVEVEIVQAAALPAVPEVPLNDDTKAIFGRMCFQCINLANALRKAGHEIERGAEHEQAAVIHWMLNLYLKHGADWRKAGDAYLAATPAHDQPEGEG